MTDPPFGFGMPDKDRDRGDSGNGPDVPGGTGGAGGGAGGPQGPLGPLGDPQQFADALRQFADLMSWQGGPVNWDLAKNVARHTVAAEGDPSVLEGNRWVRRTIADTLHVPPLVAHVMFAPAIAGQIRALSDWRSADGNPTDN